jgi:hypothetical protein
VTREPEDVVMSEAEVIQVWPMRVLVQLGDRVARLGGEAPGAPEQAYFVYSSSLRNWQPPHDAEPVSEADKALVLDAVRRHFDAKGTRYVIDPTDEQYRTS